jgi:hypothetical protein
MKFSALKFGNPISDTQTNYYKFYAIIIVEFLVLGILHGVRGKFFEDVSGAVTVPSSLIMSQNVNEQRSGMLPCIPSLLRCSFTF